jgi:hypothetical protein
MNRATPPLGMDRPIEAISLLKKICWYAFYFSNGSARGEHPLGANTVRR